MKQFEHISTEKLARIVGGKSKKPNPLAHLKGWFQGLR